MTNGQSQITNSSSEMNRQYKKQYETKNEKLKLK